MGDTYVKVTVFAETWVSLRKNWGTGADCSRSYIVSYYFLHRRWRENSFFASRISQSQHFSVPKRRPEAGGSRGYIVSYYFMHRGGGARSRERGRCWYLENRVKWEPPTNPKNGNFFDKTLIKESYIPGQVAQTRKSRTWQRWRLEYASEVQKCTVCKPN